MPNITFDFDDFRVLAGGDVTQDELEERLPLLGCDMGGISPDGEVEVEFFPDRPDLFCVEGAARAFRAFTGRRPGLAEYHPPPSGIVMHVDPSVGPVRPHIACALIKGVTFTDHGIKSLMDMQEKLHITMGRKRVKVSIGVHDADKVKPPFTYKGVVPTEVRFVPLDTVEEMDMAQILERHPKGQDYAFILEGKDRYPLITDVDGGVLSFPPIINGELTRLTEESTNIFLDVTGLDYAAVHGALTIVASALADRGGYMETVEMRYPDGVKITPDLTPYTMWLDPAYVNRMLGTSLSSADIIQSLERSGMGAAESVGGKGIDVRVPAYRLDILHPVDLVEDVAVGYGYDKFQGVLPESFSMGTPLPRRSGELRVKALLTGLGFTEVMSLTLSSEEEQYIRLHRPIVNPARVLNPISIDHTLMRTAVLPSLLSLFTVNRHKDLPQRVFELGTVVIGGHNASRVAFAEIASDSSFTRAKSLVQSVLGGLGIEFALEECLDEAFIPGRSAQVVVTAPQEQGHYGGEDIVLGVFGEIHPRTLEAFELKYPILAAELDMGAILGCK